MSALQSIPAGARLLTLALVIATLCLAILASSAAALNPQPLPPGHVIPRCLPAWACG
jgi:hypothetical protein